jgi:Kef-type K+ transport system membrane component KefB
MEISGAIVVGALLGGLVALYLRFVRRELFLFALVMAFFCSLLSQLLHVETMLTLITAGFVAENTSRWEDGEAFRHAMERAAAPIFVVFFALAGANLIPWSIAQAWYFVIPVVLLRIGAQWFGTTLGGRWARAPHEARYVWMGLVPQAGVAIGLASVVAQAYPHRGGQLQTAFLAIVAINQIIGPILFRTALSQAGEIVQGADVENTRRARDSGPLTSLIGAERSPLT